MANGQNRILLVDDQADLRRLLVNLLQAKSYIVVEVESAAAALAMFVPAQFDLIIADYAMPEMTGRELAAKVKNIAPGQPVMMLTGSREMLRDSDVPADVVLGKPFDTADLLDTIARLISSPLSSAPRG